MKETAENGGVICSSTLSLLLWGIEVSDMLIAWTGLSTRGHEHLASDIRVSVERSVAGVDVAFDQTTLMV